MLWENFPLTLAPSTPPLVAGRWIWQQTDSDMWEDGRDHVLYPWCLHVWWDHRCGPGKRWQNLFVPLLDILKVMYIKAELFLAWTVPAHIHLIWKRWWISLNKKAGVTFLGLTEKIQVIPYVHRGETKPRTRANMSHTKQITNKKLKKMKKKCSKAR